MKYKNLPTLCWSQFETVNELADVCFSYGKGHEQLTDNLQEFLQSIDCSTTNLEEINRILSCSSSLTVYKKHHIKIDEDELANLIIDKYDLSVNSDGTLVDTNLSKLVDKTAQEFNSNNKAYTNEPMPIAKLNIEVLVREYIKQHIPQITFVDIEV